MPILVSVQVFLVMLLREHTKILGNQWCRLHWRQMCEKHALQTVKKKKEKFNM